MQLVTPPALADQADREQIATALDDTLIVEAAAGTGKTTELVRRIVRVIETGRAEVTGIVAVTFTEKAAGELKLRLREALEEARGNSASESAQRGRLDRALGRLEEAQVSTIHGFCADLLRERPVEARIDPLFTVLTEAQAIRLYNEGFHQWLEGRLADPSEGVKRSLRRPTFGGFGAQADNDNGPVDRLAAGRLGADPMARFRRRVAAPAFRPLSADRRVGPALESVHRFVGAARRCP